MGSGDCMSKIVEVKEFDTIICNTDYKDDDNYIYIEKKNFESLSNFINEFVEFEDNSDPLMVMKVGYRRNVGNTISFKNYVGLIQLKNGFQIEVLPKISLGNSEGYSSKHTKEIFLKMLMSMKDFPSKIFNDAHLKIDKMNLYEIFINMYLQEVQKLLKQGIISSYTTKDDNLNCYKGKLLVGEHIKNNIVHRERFYVSYDEFHPDIPENKIVKATLEKLQKITTSAENSKKIKQLLIYFELVKPSINYEKDFSKININRNTKKYELLIQWSKVFLMNKSFTTFAGTTSSRALMFPMEAVYESYVSKKMKKIFEHNGWEVSCQDKGYYLFEEPRRQFALRPDIVIRKNHRTIILDAKWKRLCNNEYKNYGISQSDMYQMYAYSKKYNTPEIWLLYPVTEDLSQHDHIAFDSGDNTCVNLYFVDLENIEESLKELKELIEEDEINE